MTPSGHHYPSTAAWTVACSDGVGRVRFVCPCCRIPNVTEYERVGYELIDAAEPGLLPGIAGEQLAWAECLQCCRRLRLRLVGRHPEIWVHGSVLLLPPGGGSMTGSWGRRSAGQRPSPDGGVDDE